jgi:predicted ATP-dependent protease
VGQRQLGLIKQNCWRSQVIRQFTSAALRNIAHSCRCLADKYLALATSLRYASEQVSRILSNRVRHFNRLLPPPASGKRIITREIVEQVLGQKLPS